MKILKNKLATLVIICPHCGSTLELEPKDVMGGDVSAHHYKCAACNVTVGLPMDRIPKRFAELLEET